MFQLVKSAPSRPVFNIRVRQALGLSMVVALVSACGSDESGPASALRTGVFLDSAVEGLSYETATMSGTTNAAGEFNFNAGEMITFSLGDLELPPVQAANTVTPLTIFGASNVNDTRAANLSRLLQSLDSDSNVNNGIALPSAVQAIDADTSIDFASANFDTEAQAILDEVLADGTMLVDSNTATAHLSQTLVDNNLISAGCSANHPYVGQSRELSNFAHGVRGTVTVVDDCTIEVTGFNYDGGGPSVYFYAAVNKDYRNYTAIIGPRLNGQRWVNDSLRLDIPDGVTLDDFDSLSVWCSDFNANFGDVSFADAAGLQ